MDTLPRNRSHSLGTPRSPPSVSDPPPQDKERLHIEDISGWKPANHRTGLRSNPNSRRSHGKPACNLAAHMHGRSGLLPSLPPASCAAWGHDAHRITGRIVVWTSWQRLLFVTARLVQVNQKFASIYWIAPSTLGWLYQGEILSRAVMLDMHRAEGSWKIFLLVFNTRRCEFQGSLLKR